MLEPILGLTQSWEVLKNSPLPVAVYGTGNGADRVFDRFEKLGIPVSAVFASDGFVRNRFFRGFKVKSLSEIESENDDFIVALAFASGRKEVINQIKSLSLRHRVIMPSVPVYGESVFDLDFLKRHFAEAEDALGILADEHSRFVFESIIRFQITGEPDCTFNCESSKNEAFSLLSLTENESFLDIGAYRGDTISEFLDSAGGYKKIAAVEPDRRNFAKLSAQYGSFDNCFLVNSAVFSHSGKAGFSSDSGRGSNLGGNEETDLVCVDELREQFGGFTYINCDCEGYEKEMLLGAVNTLRLDKPKLCVAAYHRSEDIFCLVNLIHEINPQYKIYLRHHPHISFWDTNLYCI